MTDAAVNDLAAQVVRGVGEWRRTELAPPARDEAPAGIRLSRSSYQFQIQRAADQWTSVDVFNAGATAARFRLEIESPDGLVAGVMGFGSRDETADLPGGSWKRVRLVFNAASGTAEEYRLRLLLYDVHGE